MNTIRAQNEADQAVSDLIALSWQRAGHGHDARDTVIEQQASVLRELARSSPLAKSFIEQRVETLRGKRSTPQLEIAHD